jgi:hypothetical protein
MNLIWIDSVITAFVHCVCVCVCHCMLRRNLQAPHELSPITRLQFNICAEHKKSPWIY